MLRLELASTSGGSVPTGAETPQAGGWHRVAEQFVLSVPLGLRASPLLLFGAFVVLLILLLMLRRRLPLRTTSGGLRASWWAWSAARTPRPRHELVLLGGRALWAHKLLTLLRLPEVDVLEHERRIKVGAAHWHHAHLATSSL